MDIAFEIEEAANEAVAFTNLFMATIEAAFNNNGSYKPEQYGEAFNYLYYMAHKHSQCLKTLEEKVFKLLQTGKEAVNNGQDK